MVLILLYVRGLAAIWTLSYRETISFKRVFPCAMQQFIAALQTRDLFSVFQETSARAEARSRICGATLRAAPRPGRRKNSKFQIKPDSSELVSGRRVVTRRFITPKLK